MTVFVRRDGAVAATLAAAALALYVVCLPPSFAFWDTGELQTVAAILGIAHPPACPAFVLAGWLFVHALPFGEPAWRLGFMCACAVAASVALLYAVARGFGATRAASALVSIGFATAAVPWRDATRAEVQDLSLLLRALALLLALRYARHGSARDAFALGLVTGLAGATHGIALLLLPSLALCLFARREARAVRTVAVVLGGVALGLLPYAYLPLRSAAVAALRLDPTLALGLAPGAQPFWDYDHPATWPAFVRVLTGADFHVASGFAGFVDFTRYLQYAAALVVHVAGAYGYAGTLLAAVGAALLVARERVAGVGLVLAGLLPVPYTQSYADLQDPDRYYLLSLWCAAVAVAAALDALVALLDARERSPVRLMLGAGFAASLVSSSLDRGAFFNQRYDRNAQHYVDAVVGLTPADAIVVAEWAYATPLAYAAYVQHAFGSRAVVSAAPAQLAAHYSAWLARRPLYVVTFNDALEVPGFAVAPVADAYYHVYRISPLRGGSVR